MLVLSRKRGQSIQIGDDILVEILEFSGRRVKIGIEAPKDHPILRGELSRREDVASEGPRAGQPRAGCAKRH